MAKAESEEPVLEELKLAVRGHVFVAYLRPIQGGYTLNLVDGSKDWDKVAVFPDLQPPGADDNGLVKFCVNTRNGIHAGKDFGLVTDATHENGVHHGSGLIMECTVSHPQPTFQRTGAFTFQGLSEEEWEHVTSTDDTFVKTLHAEVDQLGLNFWLA